MVEIRTLPNEVKKISADANSAYAYAHVPAGKAVMTAIHLQMCTTSQFCTRYVFNDQQYTLEEWREVRHLKEAPRAEDWIGPNSSAVQTALTEYVPCELPREYKSPLEGCEQLSVLASAVHVDTIELWAGKANFSQSVSNKTSIGEV